LIGIKISPLKGKIERQKYGPSQALYLAIKETYNTIAMTLSYIGKMITGKESADQLGGPIKIAQISGKVAEHGLVPFLSIMAYISISLGLINLFPIPLLDGGHLFFYLIEFIRGKPLSENVQIYFYKFGMAVLFSLMFFATFNDLKSLGLF
jgi:regulator of sigma E protease